MGVNLAAMILNKEKSQIGKSYPYNYSQIALMKNDFEVIVDDDIVRVFNTRSGLQACINLKEGGRLSKWFLRRHAHYRRPA